MQLGCLGHYGPIVDRYENIRVIKMNRLIDEWNETVPNIEGLVEQQLFVSRWRKKMERISTMPACRGHAIKVGDTIINTAACGYCGDDAVGSPGGSGLQRASTHD